MNTTTVEELLKLVEGALVGQGFPLESASDIATEFVVADVAGTRTHGVAKLISMNLGDLTVAPVIDQRGPIISVDGRGCNGFLLMREVTQLASECCGEFGLAAAFVRNFSRYSSLYPYTAPLARRGFVGLLMNTAGPPAVAPFGGVDPVTGTNPLCMSFPLPAGGVQTFDFATSEMVWGEIRQATLEGRGLRSGPFLADTGDVTTDPGQVNAVRAFGGSKGWALNLAIEILAGLMSGAAAGSSVESEFDCGAMLLAIDPRATGAGENFSVRIAQLFDEVRNARPESPSDSVRCPGDRARSQIDLEDHLNTELSPPEAVVEMLQRMAEGVKLSELSSNPLFN